MEGHGLVWATLALFGLTAVVASAALLRQERSWMRAALACLVAAFLANTAMLAARWIGSGQPPFQTRYETLLFYPWCIAVVALLLIGLFRLHVLVPFVSLAPVLFLGYGLMNPDIELRLLPPALQSGWFVPHVMAYFVAYAALLVSCVLAVLAILDPGGFREEGSSAGAPLRGRASRARGAHLAAVFGVAVLTLGLVLGAVWGKSAWGDYWSWDPKENWALVTWLSYVVYLHLARMPGWQGRRSAWLLVVSFGAVMFTWLGMHLLPTAEGSLHVYQ